MPALLPLTSAPVCISLPLLNRSFQKSDDGRFIATMKYPSYFPIMKHCQVVVCVVCLCVCVVCLLCARAHVYVRVCVNVWVHVHVYLFGMCSNRVVFNIPQHTILRTVTRAHVIIHHPYTRTRIHMHNMRTHTHTHTRTALSPQVDETRRVMETAFNSRCKDVNTALLEQLVALRHEEAQVGMAV